MAWTENGEPTAGLFQTTAQWILLSASVGWGQMGIQCGSGHQVGDVIKICEAALGHGAIPLASLFAVGARPGRHEQGSSRGSLNFILSVDCEP